MSRQQVSCEDDIQIDVCVLNPPDGQPVRKLTKNDWEQLDLFADVSTKEGGPPTLTIGCTWNNLWVPLRLREPNRWWDRLSCKPKRFFLSTTDTVLSSAPTPLDVSKCTQYESSKRLVSLPKRFFETQEEQLHHTQKYSAGDGLWWDRLNGLPGRRIIYKQTIFSKYQELLQKLTEEINERSKQKLRQKDEYINRRNNKHFLEELQSNITLNDAAFSDEYITDRKLNNLHVTEENNETNEVQLLDNSKELAVSELLDILRLEIEEAEGSLSFDFDKLSVIEELEEEKTASLENLLSDGIGNSPISMHESQEIRQSTSRQSDHDVFEKTIGTEDASELGTLEILSNIDTDEADTLSDLADIDAVTNPEGGESPGDSKAHPSIDIESQHSDHDAFEQVDTDEADPLSDLADIDRETIPEGEEEKESSGASKDAPAERKGKKVKKKRRKVVDPNAEPWWERLSKPPARILAAFYVPLTKPIKKRRRKWVGLSDEYWVERLSKPRRPVVRRESFKPKRLEINKRSQRLIQRKRKETHGNDYWWLRLSKPRGMQTSPKM